MPTSTCKMLHWHEAKNRRCRLRTKKKIKHRKAHVYAQYSKISSGAVRKPHKQHPFLTYPHCKNKPTTAPKLSTRPLPRPKTLPKRHAPRSIHHDTHPSPRRHLRTHLPLREKPVLALAVHPDGWKLYLQVRAHLRRHGVRRVCSLHRLQDSSFARPPRVVHHDTSRVVHARRERANERALPEGRAV